jgi:hypothetical protein
MAEGPNFPNDSQHVALAGMNGSGKTWGAMDMLSFMDLREHAAFIIDHKGEPDFKKLPAEKFNPASLLLPRRGLHIIKPKLNGSNRQELEEFLERVFKHGRMRVYVDEGHLMGFSNMVRNILVAGRARKATIMWTSKKANWIDPFVWSQSKFYRVFTLQTAKDVKAVQENWPVKFQMPEQFHSWYYDGTTNKAHYLLPADKLGASIERLDAQLRHDYSMI